MVRQRFDGMNIDYSASYSNSATYYDASHRNEKYDGGQPQGTVTLSLGNVGWNVDRSKDAIWPTITQTQGPDIYDVGNYSALRISRLTSGSRTRVIQSSRQVRSEEGSRLALPTFVKTGSRYQRQTRKFWADRRRFDYTGPDGDSRQRRRQSRHRSVHRHRTRGLATMRIKYYQNRGGVPPWANAYAVAKHQIQNPQFWREDITFGTQERLTAARRRRRISRRPTSWATCGSAGCRCWPARVSRIRVSEGEGPLNHLSPAERARRAAYVGVVTDAELERRAIAQFGGRQTAEGDYKWSCRACT